MKAKFTRPVFVLILLSVIAALVLGCAAPRRARAAPTDCGQGCRTGQTGRRTHQSPGSANRRSQSGRRRCQSRRREAAG